MKIPSCPFVACCYIITLSLSYFQRFFMLRSRVFPKRPRQACRNLPRNSIVRERREGRSEFCGYAPRTSKNELGLLVWRMRLKMSYCDLRNTVRRAPAHQWLLGIIKKDMWGGFFKLLGPVAGVKWFRRCDERKKVRSY